MQGAVVKKPWVVAVDAVVESLSEVEDLLLGQLEIVDDDRDSFFDPLYDRDVHDPFLLEGMGQAVERLLFAAAHGERVLVYGDYDMDGISATATLVSVLHAWGISVVPYLPHRIDDGYGLNVNVLESLVEEFDLVVTVDCGVSNVEEVAWLKERGKDVIVVDHHEVPPELPEALAVLHPRHPKSAYPWGHLAGAGVTFKLAQALARQDSFPERANVDWEKWLLDLPLLGTVGDMMPLLGENRALVRFGMEVLRRTRRPGLSVMMEAVGLQRSQLGVEDLSFRLIPLFNAAGRIDHPQAGLDVLMAADVGSAQVAVERLVTLNKERRSLTTRLVKEAQEQVKADSAVIFVVNTKWPAGLVGLVAGQLARAHGRPAVAVGGNGRHAVGSARSVPGVNILEGLRAAEEHMLKLGGHAEAAGFSVEEESLSEVEAVLESFFESRDEPIEGPVPQAVARLSGHLISWDLWRLMERFQPFGMGNEKPMFEFVGLEVLDAKLVGKKQEHARLVLGTGEREIAGIAFGQAGHMPEPGAVVSVLGQLDLNTFRGRTELQLRVEGVAVESAQYQKDLVGARAAV